MGEPAVNDSRYWRTYHVHNIGTVKVTPERTEYPCVTCGGTVRIPTRGQVAARRAS